MWIQCRKPQGARGKAAPTASRRATDLTTTNSFNTVVLNNFHDRFAQFVVLKVKTITENNYLIMLFFFIAPEQNMERWVIE